MSSNSRIIIQRKNKGNLGEEESGEIINKKS